MSNTMASRRNSAPLVLNSTEDLMFTEQVSDRDIMKVDYMKFDKDFIAWSDAFPGGLSATNSTEAQQPNSSAMVTSFELNQVDTPSVSNRLPIGYRNCDSEIKQEKQNDICSAQRSTHKHKLDFAFRLITAGHQSLNNNLIQAENRTVHVKSFVPHSAASYSAPSDEVLHNNSDSNIIYENKSMAMAFMRMMIKNRSFRQQMEAGKKTVLQVVNEENIVNKLKITADHTPDTCIGASTVNWNAHNWNARTMDNDLDPQPSASMTSSSMVEGLNGRNSFKVNCHKKCYKITPPWLKYAKKLEKLAVTMDDDNVTKDNMYAFESKTTSVDNKTASLSNLKKIYQKAWTRDQFNVAMDHTYSCDGTDTKTPVDLGQSYVSGSKYFVRKSYI